jgi:BTB And C-terminal Kelch
MFVIVLILCKLALKATPLIINYFVCQVIEQQTQMVIKDGAFNSISKDNILKLVSRNGLAIYEYELYQAIVKWATVRAVSENLEITPTKLRNFVGAEILQKIRFLTMSSEQFSRVYTSFKILSYDEILPIIFNINDEKSVPLPETISPSTKHRRNDVSQTFLTYKALNSCNLPTLKADNRYLVHFTSKGVIITHGESITALKVQVPMSIESSQSCCKIKERFDILLFDNIGNNILRKSFDGFPTCNTVKMASCNGTDRNSIDTNLIDVQLNGITLHDNYSIQIEYHKQAREYPKLPKLRGTTNCRPKYVRTVDYNDYGEEESQEIRDSETKSKCSVNEFVYLTYY